MKNVSLSFIAILAFTFCQAQEKKVSKKSNNIFLSGLMSYVYEKDNNNNAETTTFEFEPTLGYFVTPHVIVGGLAGYRSVITKSSSVTTSDQSLYTVGAFSRYFFVIDKAFEPFIEGSVGYAYAKENKTNKSVDGFGTSVNFGFVYWIAKHLALQSSFTGISYASAAPNLDGTRNVKAFSFGGNLKETKVGIIIRL